MTTLDRRALIRIVGEQCGTVKVSVIEQRRKVSSGGDAEAGLDHTAAHHDHAVRTRRGDHSQRFTQAAAFRELDVDAVDDAGELRDVTRDNARFVGDDRER